MNRFFTMFVLLVLVAQSKAIDGTKVRLGFQISPGFSWFTPSGKALKAGPMGYAMTYGMPVEYYFKDQNYAFVTGLHGGMEAGAVKGRLFNYQTLPTANATVTERYFNHFISIPIAIKLKTNPIKNKFRIFGQVGLSTVITVSSRATFSSKFDLDNSTGVQELDITKENILKKDNDVTKLIPNFRGTYFDLRLDAGAGFEYDFDKNTSGLFSISFHNGFINQLNDQDAAKEPIIMRNIRFNFAVMF